MNLFKHYLLVLAISLLPLWSFISSPDLPHTHDGAVHLPRMAAYYKALKDGQVLPRWAGDLNYSYGMPLFNFIYHTPYLISAVFISLGLGLVTTFKLVIAISYLLSGIFMFLFSQYFFKNHKHAFLVTIFYQFIPFRLVEMLVRGSFGEMYAYTFLPLALYGIIKTIHTHRLIDIILTAFATGLLIISHNSISLVFFILTAAFGISFSKSKADLTYIVLGLIFGLALSMFYWTPALLEHKYTYGDLLMKDLYKTHFPPIFNFFLPNFSNDSKYQTGGISVQLGIFHVIGLALSLWILFKRKLDRNIKILLIFSISFIVLPLFFMSYLSIFFWQKIAFLRQFQFPWRLLSVTSIATSLCAISYLRLPIFKNRVFYFLLIAATIISTAYYWYPPLGFDHISSENSFWNFPLNTTYFGETDVVWSAGPAKGYPKAPVETIAGNANISEYSKRSNVHTFLVQNTQDATFVDNTQYFPGWRVYVDNQKTPIQFQDQNWRGLITFRLPSGTHRVIVKFEKSKIQYLSELASWSSLLLALILCLFSFRNLLWAKKR